MFSTIICVHLVIIITIKPYLVLLARIPSFGHSRKAFVLEYFKNCDDRVYPLTHINYTFLRSDSTLFINGEDVLSRDLKDPLGLQIHVERCADRSNLNKCEHFTTLKWNDFCAAHSLIPIFKGFLEAHTPPMHCPLKKNRYYLKRVAVQLDLLETFLTQGSSTRSLMKVHTLLTEGSHPIACTESGTRIATLRSRV